MKTIARKCLIIEIYILTSKLKYHKNLRTYIINHKMEESQTCWVLMTNDIEVILDIDRLIANQNNTVKLE